MTAQRLFLSTFLLFWGLSACTNSIPKKPTEFPYYELPLKVAILPVQSSESMYNKDVLIGTNKQRLAKNYYLQQLLFKQIAQEIRKGTYRFVLQNFTESNQLLEKNGVNFLHIFDTDKVMLAKTVASDVIIVVKVVTNVEDTQVNSIRTGHKSSLWITNAQITLEAYSADSGKLIWKETQKDFLRRGISGEEGIYSSVTNELSKHLNLQNATQLTDYQKVKN